MGLLIDTGVLIRVERSAVGELDFSPWERYGDVAISVISASELLAGVHRAVPESRRIRRSASVEAMLAALPILDVTLEVARIHAEVVAALRQARPDPGRQRRLDRRYRLGRRPCP